MNPTGKAIKTDEEWKKELTPQQYHILRQAGTEAPFTGEYVNEHGKGMFRCAACGNPLFDSETKFDSGSGWPSFYQPINNENVETRTDTSAGTMRQEVACRRCGSHLGHVFPDGPPDKTGLRYCINSCALKMERK
jgi:peptide-methionine (R)-S-oxide reductase